MTDPRRLTDAALAAIGERAAADLVPPDYHRQMMGIADCRALLAHIAYLDEQLTTQDRLQHYAYTTLQERVAEAERDANASAEVVDQLVDAHRERQDLLTAMTQKVMEQGGQLATEKAARVAAGGQVTELTSQIGKLADLLTQMYDRFQVGQEFGEAIEVALVAASAALASPDRGASAPDPATVTGMREFIKEVAEFPVAISNALFHIQAVFDWQKKAAALLGPAATEEKAE